MYSVEIESWVFKDLNKIPQNFLDLIRERIYNLKTNPRPPQCEKLHGYKNRYRIRRGDYRILYTIDDQEKIVKIFRVDHRKDVYRRLHFFI